LNKTLDFVDNVTDFPTPTNKWMFKPTKVQTGHGSMLYKSDASTKPALD